MARVGHNAPSNLCYVRVLRYMDGNGEETELEGRWRTRICRYSWVSLGRVDDMRLLLWGHHTCRPRLSARCWLVFLPSCRAGLYRALPYRRVLYQ